MISLVRTDPPGLKPSQSIIPSPSIQLSPTSTETLPQIDRRINFGLGYDVDGYFNDSSVSFRESQAVGEDDRHYRHRIKLGI